MAAHRYWRVYITANCADGAAGQGYVSLMEVELRTSLGGSNVATGGTASASSIGFGWVAANAFNGTTTGDGWHSGTNAMPGTPEWLSYDLGPGNDKDIVEFVLHVRGSFVAQWPRSFQLQYSDDNSAWTTLYDIHTAAWNGVPADPFLTFNATSIPNDAGVSQRFWRVRATANNGGANFTLSELMMYVAGSATNQCSGGTPFANSLEAAAYLPDAFDGTLASSGSADNYWATYSGATGWIGYKFPTARTISTIGINANYFVPGQSPKDFLVEYWDGSAYQTAFSLTNITGWSAGQTRYFDATGEVAGPPASPPARPQVCVCT